MKIFYIFIGLLFTLSSSLARGSNPQKHLIGPSSEGATPTVPAEMNWRIEQSAEEYKNYAPIPRIALTDIALPKDAGEYASLHGYGVLLLTAIAQKKDELPPKRVYVQVSNSVFPLQLLVSGFEPSSGSQIVQYVFGKFRWDGIYLFPVFLAKNTGDVALDFAKDRSGFVVEKFDSKNFKFPPYFKRLKRFGYKTTPPANLIHKFVLREYPGFLRKNDSGQQ